MTTTDIESLAQFDDIQAHLNPKIELIVLFFFDPFHEKCGRMETNFDGWSEDDQYTDRVLFLKCDKNKCNHDIFEKYNVKTMPTILFIKNNEQVAPPVTKSNANVEEIIDGIINGKK